MFKYNHFTTLGGLKWQMCVHFFIFLWGCFLFFIYINKNETRCRVTTMPLLTTLWVNQLVLFQHHVTADQRVPISLTGVVTWPRCYASHQVPPTLWFLSMRFPASSSTSTNLNPINRGPLHFINQSASLFPILNTTSASAGTAFGVHPLSSSPRSQNKQGKSASTPSNQPTSNFISPTFAPCGKSSAQFDLPHHQSGLLASFLSSKCPFSPK